MTGRTNSFSEAMLEIMDGLRVQEEAARGYKVELEEKGWTPVVAEKIAAQLLIDMNRAIFRGVGK